jgi:hypothetical protein
MIFGRVFGIRSGAAADDPESLTKRSICLVLGVSKESRAPDLGIVVPREGKWFHQPVSEQDRIF